MKNERFAMKNRRFLSRLLATGLFALLSGAVSKLTALGVSASDITVAYVPGAFELPGVCRKMIAAKKVDAVIALGAVIRGETPHFDVVVNAVTSGIANLAATSDIPVLFLG